MPRLNFLINLKKSAIVTYDKIKENITAIIAKKFSLKVFVIYRIALSLFILAIVYL